MDRLKERLEIARKALVSFREALREPVTHESRCLDPAVRVHVRGRLEGGATLPQEPRKPRIAFSSVTRARFQSAVLNEEQGRMALGMATDRNLTVHTCNEELANQIYSRLAAYAGLMENWLAAMWESAGSNDESPRQQGRRPG